MDDVWLWLMFAVIAINTVGWMFFAVALVGAAKQNGQLSERLKTAETVAYHRLND